MRVPRRTPPRAPDPDPHTTPDPAPDSDPASRPGTARRGLLTASGLAALAAAGTAVATARPAVAAEPAGVLRFDTVAALRAHPVEGVPDGALALVAGYHAPGDGGGSTVRWDAGARAAHNGGTVLAPKAHPDGPGRWRQLHDGVLDFRTFGHVGAEVEGGTQDARPADDALAAMLADPAVHRVEAHTDLRFVRRHTVGRSGIELDFGGHRVSTDGMAENTADNPFGALLYFRGTVTDTVHTHTLTADLPERTDVLEVGDAAAFTVDQWWAVQCDALAGRWERELQRLVRITEVVDGTHIRVNYQTGWPLAAGRTLTWTRVEPVHRAHVRNMVFTGAGRDERTGSHPVAYEYAVRCDVSGIEASGTFWPVIMRRWCTHFRTDDCSLANPVSVTAGGAGYLTQQIYCLYGQVANCHATNARHLNDFTASSSCQVTNCHADGDDQGPFVTHGQYEHDLVYTGNSGLMTFANSGAAWGGAAKRITVRRHTCSWFVARTAVTDLTLEDVTVLGRKGLPDSGALWVNADGVQLRGCTASGPLVITQSSARSDRPNTVADSAFTCAEPGAEIVAGNVSAPVTLCRTTLRGLNGAVLAGTGRLVLEECRWEGASDADPVTLAHPETVVTGGVLRDTGLNLPATDEQRLSLTGTRLTGRNARNALLGRGAGEATVTWHLDGVESTASDTGTAHLRLTGGENRVRGSGTAFTGGRLELRPEAFGGPDSHLLLSGCVERGTARVAMPEEGERVAHTSGNLLL